MAQTWCGKHKNKENSNTELKQFYCVAKEHYPELVGRWLEFAHIKKRVKLINNN